MAYFSETAYGADGVWISGSLGAARTTAGVLSWTNPEGVSVLVDSILLDVTTAATSGTCTIDVGATTSSIVITDTMIDGASTASTARIYNHLKDAGSNGLGAVKVAKGNWITGTEKTGSVVGLVGTYYIHYKKVRP